MKRLVFLLLQFSVLNTVNAQDFEHLPVLDSNLDEWYGSLVDKTESPIMQGTYYYRDEEQIKSPNQNPFYESGWDQSGAIVYEGRLYPNTNIIYNISKDVLLVWSWEMKVNGIQALRINQTKIDSFIIHNQKFLHNKHAKVGSEGFYRQVMRGKHVSCYAKEKKTGSLNGVVYEYEKKRQYYISYADRTFDYTRIPSLYKVFPAHKKEIKKYVKQSAFKRSDERLLIDVLNYCDSIVK